MNTLSACSVNELKVDIGLCISLMKQNLSQLHDRMKDLGRCAKKGKIPAYGDIKPLCEYLRQEYVSRLDELVMVLKSDTLSYGELLSFKKKSLSFLRFSQSYFAATMIASDWQSPSFTHSLESQAGSQTGRISGTINDYKRDRHLDEEPYEKEFIRQYIDTPGKSSLRALLTANGMAAFTTIFHYLLAEKKISGGKVLLGQSSYFQYKELIEKELGRNVVLFNETNTTEIVKLVKKHKPSVFFIDSLSNSSRVTVPDLRKILPLLGNYCEREMYAVIDNTALSFFCQPHLYLKNRNHRIRLILFESLMKYHHFGFDRTPGGIIITDRNTAAQLFEYRKNLGTNIPDFGVYCFPFPDRQLLAQRLKRFHRNATALTMHLQTVADRENTPLLKVTYPGLINHPAHGFFNISDFHGSYFVLEFKKPYRSVSYYKSFIQQLIRIARKYGVDLTGGTSFGFDTTRVYLTSLWTDYGEPFVRVSVGTEDILALEKLKTVFAETLHSSGSLFPEKALSAVNSLKKKLRLEKVM